MKVILSAGDRFHSYALAKELLNRQALQRLYTFNYSAKDAQSIPPSFVKRSTTCAILNTLYQKARLSRFINRTTFNTYKDRLFENNVNHWLQHEPKADIVVCWSGFLHHCLSTARRTSTKIILETGSCHTDQQAALIKKEYDSYGLTINSHNKKRQALARQEYAEADLIMAPSDFVKQSFVNEGFSADKIAVVPYGVDTSFFTPALTKPIGNSFTFLFVGMVSLQKGIHYLLRAWQQADLDQNKTQLVIIGALQKDFLQVRHKLPQARNVIFTGGISREALRSQYQAANVFVLPSVQEGFAMVIGEAMACGLPVIASTHTGASNIINHETSGLLYNPYEIETLAGLLRWCYQNPEAAATLGQAANKQIQKHTWNDYGNAVFATYKKLVGHE
jgi:glycosyltransferase involved in cell wall biosynthesis